MHGEPDDSAAVRQAQWLRAAYTGASVDDDELLERVSESWRASQGWESAEAFQRSLDADDASVGGVRAAGDEAAIEVRTPGGLRLERLVRLDGDGRIASVTPRLAGGASMTMVSAAAWRAAHTEFDDPVIVSDPLAGVLVGDASPYQADAVRAGTHGTDGMHYRFNMAARARFAEDTLAAQRDRFGVGQYVVLGAGLDTFAQRNPFDDVTVFEVDTPESQTWKLDRLAQTGIARPGNARYITCDFESQDFVDRLVGVGFDVTAPAVAAWLGVTYYLTDDAIRATLERVGSWPAGTAIVFDYLLTESRWDEFEGFDADAMRATIAGVAAAGEQMHCQFDDDELVDLCRSCGFDEVELLSHDDMRVRFMAGQTSPTPGPDPVIKLACARVT